jgi:PAS domain S-box-containing protein
MHNEMNSLRRTTAARDWAGMVEAIVRRAPASASQPSDLRAQVRLLALLGSAAPLNVLLDGLATYVESWHEGLHCTVLLADPAGRLLLPGAAPSLPATYALAIGPVPIEEGHGCCGSAAARREMVIVEDIEQSSLWARYAPIALSHGLRACWSAPILDDARTLLGTLALYYRERRVPSAGQAELIQFASSLAAFVMQRHRDAERLRTSEARLEAAVWGADLGLWEASPAGDARWLNNWCERFDIDPCIGHNTAEPWNSRIHPDDIDAYLDTGRPPWYEVADQYVNEYRIRDRNGDWRWIHERGKVTVRDRDGAPLLFAGVCIDIDDKKRTEAALRSAEDRYELAIDAARLPVWEYDVASNTVTGNVYWHRTLEYEVSAAEARQRTETWLSDIHPDDRPAQERFIIGEAAGSTDFYQSEFRVRTATGEYKWLLDRGRVVERAADGSPLKAVGISLDIDARKRMESALRASLREKEVLLQEVHHRVKNNLQVISSLINMQLRRLKDASTRDTLSQCRHRVQAIALIHEQLYRSKSLASVPLPDYISSLARDIVQAAGVPATNVALGIAIADIALPVDQAIPCGLVLNELMTNALKHAFPDGRQGSLRINVERLDDSHLRLTVADDGVGLPAAFDIGSCQSMGLYLVNNLAAQLNARLEVDGHGGTSFQLTFPIAPRTAA